MTNGAPPPPPPGAMPASQPPTKKRKGIPLLGWIAIGCGAMIIAVALGFAALGWFAVSKVKEVAADFEENPAKAAAEMVVKLNPDLELIESNEDAGTITVREKSTDKVVTFDYEELEEGRFSFESDEGRVEVDAQAEDEGGLMTISSEEGETRIGAGGELPSWIPLHPATTSTTSIYQQTGPDGENGAGSATVDADPAAVFAFYEERLEAEGFEVTTTTFSGGEEWRGMVTGSRDDGKTTLGISVGSKDGATEVGVQYHAGG